MIKFGDIQKYEAYIKYLDKKLEKIFAEQKPYIFCKEGCSYCCTLGEYPFSEVEFAYLMVGVQTLSSDIQNKIEQNMKKIKYEKEQNKKKKFLYACPFLINNRCSLYKYRGIICRSHGAAFFSKENKLMVPACVEKGLNYSNVYDLGTQKISVEKYKALGVSQEPLAHNIGLHYLTNNEMTKAIELDFGELKPMCEWFVYQIK